MRTHTVQRPEAVKSCTMFETIADIPAHPLFVHAAVAFVPVAALLAVITAACSPARAGTLRTATAIASTIGAMSAIIARSSGEAMLPMLGLSEENLGEVTKHAEYSLYAVIAAVALALVALLLWWTGRKEYALSGTIVLILRIVLVILAITAVITVVLTGHEGARLVWTSELAS